MIRFDDVHKAFGSRTILNGVSFEIPPHKTTVIFGISGGGKSTIIKHIVGLLQPDSGHIYVDDVNVNQANEEKLLHVRKKVGFLFQHGALFDSMNIRDNVAFPIIEHQKLSKNEVERIVDEKLSMVGLDPKVVKTLYPDELSGGMRKRVGLARTLALEPEIILYDEPTSGLDPVTSDLITQMIRRLQKTLGMTSVLISHDINESFKAGDHFLMLFEGKIIAQGDETFFKTTDNAVIQQFINSRSKGPISFDH